MKSGRSVSEWAAWGILGTGGIATLFAAAMHASSSGRLAAVASRDPARARAFAARVGSPSAAASYATLLGDPAIEIVYVATPHPTHAELAIAALEAGKHVLCEKPLAVTHADAERIVDAARRAGRFLVEGFAFRHHPQTRRLVELLRDGIVGEVRAVDAPFGYDAGTTPENYLFERELAGGSILDVGCYPVAMVRLIAGAVSGLPFRDPDVIVGTGALHPEHGIDLDAAAVARYDDGLTAQLMCSIRTVLDTSLRITGTSGTVTLPSAWLPERWGGPPVIVIERPEMGSERIDFGPTAGLYATEIDAVVTHVRAGRIEAPEMTWDDSLGNVRTLDAWRSAVGVRYPDDERVGPA